MIFLFIAAILVLSIRIWGLNQDTILINSRLNEVQGEVHAIILKEKGLAVYKDETALPLDQYYLQVYNDIKEIAAYYNEACEVKIAGAKDLTALKDLFKPSVYEGIKYFDILCRFSLSERTGDSLLRMFCGLNQAGPMEILEVCLKKNTVVLIMRLYGT